MSERLVNRATGAEEIVDDVPSALASGKYLAPDAVAVHRNGEDTYAAPDVALHEQAFNPIVDPTVVALARGHAQRAAEHQGIVSGAKALAGGAIDSATFGAVSPFDEDQEFHSTLSTIGGIGGALLPGAFGGESAVLARAGIGGDALSAERAASSLSSPLLFAGKVGAEGGEAAQLERSVLRAGSALDEAKAATGTATALPQDLAGLDAKGLKQAHAAELENIEAGRVPQRAQLTDDLATFRADLKDQKLWLATKGSEDPEIRALGKRTLKADKSLDNLLDDPKLLATDPERAMSSLRKQESALEDIMKREGAIREAAQGSIETEKAAAAEKIRNEYYASDAYQNRFAKNPDGSVRVSGMPAAPTHELESMLAKSADEITASRGARANALDKIPAALERNRALQERIGALAAEPSSARLAAIGDARDALAAGGRPASLPEQMLQGSVFHHVSSLVSMTPLGPLASAIGAKASKLIGDAVFGRLGNATGRAAARTGEAVSAFMDVGKRAAPFAIPEATKILSRLSYGPATAGAATYGKDLAGVFKARAAEIKSQTAYDANGQPVMTPEARAAMAARLAPIRAHAPKFADMMETLAARRLEFLSSKLPRRPDLGGMQVGPDHWQPSDMEMRAFARYAAAVENPGAVEERMIHGSITPEDTEAYHAVYPERAAHLKQQIIEGLPTLQKQLPYERRLALSLFSGVPVDPAMNPRILAILQGSFAEEPGTQGGTSAPVASPQFGSVRKSVPAPTPAQSRSQGDLT